MADKKISELTEATEINLTDVFPFVQTGTTKKIQFTNIQKEIVNYLTATSVTAEADTPIDLGDSTYDHAEIIKLSWTGANGTAIFTLPDATTTNNQHRVIRFISDSTFSTNTRVHLTPSGSQELDGSNSHYEINKAYEGIQIRSDGTEWFIIQKKA